MTGSAPQGTAQGVQSVERLTMEGCLELLGQECIGRIALTQRRKPPLVVPVSYVISGRRLLFRAGYGAVYPAALADPVSFQVDQTDPVTRSGWSVLVHGRVNEVREREVGPVLPEPWTPEVRPYLLALSISEATGRRLHAG